MRRCLYLLSNDLRLDDNPALSYTLDADEAAVLYFRDLSSPWLYTGAAAWWLHRNLESLSTSLFRIGLQLNLLSGDSQYCLQQLIEEHEFTEVCCSRAYFPHERTLQKQLYMWCQNKGISFKRFPGTLLFEPEDIANKQGRYYRVFTPFYKACLQKTERNPISFPESIKASPIKLPSEDIESWHLIPNTPNWSEPIAKHWEAGESAAREMLRACIETVISSYEDERNNMSEPNTSRLSAYLNLGIISPARIWLEVSSTVARDNAASWLRQLVWREFNYHLIFHDSDLDTKPFQEKFSNFDWEEDPQKQIAWQTGKTGYPVVDAAMRELWLSGWMHNRARMIVASFLTKHLRQHWLVGARWFWSTLIDADLANNTGGWQWTAGCGADAAPYFRIFNPITQGQKFDKRGAYVRRWLPELAELPDKYLFSPWEAPPEVLEQAGVKLGKNYPHPIVDHKQARECALEAYSSISK